MFKLLSMKNCKISRSRDKGRFSPIAHESAPLKPKHKNKDEDDEEEIDTDLETDRLLGHQMLDDGFYDEKGRTDIKPHSLTTALSSKISPKTNENSSMTKSNSSTILRHGLNVLLPISSSECCINSPSMLNHSTSFHQSRSLKTSPSLNMCLLSNLTHSNVENSPHRQNKNSTPLINQLLDEEKDQSAHIIASEVSELCNMDNELVDSPGGSSSDKSKKDDVHSGDKKKKNKNKEGKIFEDLSM